MRLSKSAWAAMPLVLALGGSTAAVSTAWAGADDGGNKSFYMGSHPGDYGYTAPAAPAASDTIPDSGATAAVNSGAYQQYRSPVHKRRHAAPAQ